MPMNNLEDLFKEEIKDMYSAETQIVEALPKMAQAASDSDLKKAFEMHLEQTREHVRRLDQVKSALGITDTKHCKGMEGLIKEGEEIIKEKGDADTKDAALIMAAQKVEHYEIASYGTLCTYAERLHNGNVLDLLKQNMSDEEATDKKLTKIAEGHVNRQAAQ